MMKMFTPVFAECTVYAVDGTISTYILQKKTLSWYSMVRYCRVLKFRTLFFYFSEVKLVSRAKIHKMLVSIANRECSDHTASSKAV